MRRLSQCLRRQWLSLILAAVLGGFTFAGLCGSSGMRDLLTLRYHSSALTRQRDALLAENAQLRERVSRLNSDDTYLQKLIRKELGYVQPGEIVYRFADSAQP